MKSEGVVVRTIPQPARKESLISTVVSGGEVGPDRSRVPRRLQQGVSKAGGRATTQLGQQQKWRRLPDTKGKDGKPIR